MQHRIWRSLANCLQVVLRYGGVYADLDTECRQPMDALIQPRDTLVACWENEFSTEAEAERRNYVRPRQVTCCLIGKSHNELQLPPVRAVVAQQAVRHCQQGSGSVLCVMCTF